jgi:hypothetical protein
VLQNVRIPWQNVARLSTWMKRFVQRMHSATWVDASDNTDTQW